MISSTLRAVFPRHVTVCFWQSRRGLQRHLLGLQALGLELRALQL